MRGNFKDLTGMVIGKLTIKGISRRHRTLSGGTIIYYECICECGTISIVAASSLLSKTRPVTQCQQCGRTQAKEKQKGVSCIGRGIRYTKNTFIIAVNKVYGEDMYNYDSIIYINSKIKIDILCNGCKNIFSMRPSEHLRGKGCPICAREKRRNKHVFIDGIENKICYVCKKPKPLDRYSPKTKHWDNLDVECKDCRNARLGKYYKTNKKAKKDSQLRKSVGAPFKVNGIKKTKHTHEILEVSLDEADAHLETTFDIGMTWDNRHLWARDHIIPHSYFTKKARKNKKSLHDECVKSGHYTNFQALWNDENIDKSDKLDWDRQEYRERCKDQIKRGIRKTIPPWYYIEINGSLEGYE